MHILLSVILIVFILLTTVFWLWMLGDSTRNKSFSKIQKIVWFLVIFFTHFLGALAYFLVGRSTNTVAHQPKGQPASPTPLIEQYEQPDTAYPKQS